MAEQKKQTQQKPGVARTIIKIIMIIVFALIGIVLIVGGSLGLAGKVNITLGGEEVKIHIAVWIVMLVFGIMLLVSPIMLNKKATGFWWVFKIVFVVIFIAIGLTLIAGWIYILVVDKVATSALWLPICSMIFGVMLLTSPIFLKL